MFCRGASSSAPLPQGLIVRGGFECVILATFFSPAKVNFFLQVQGKLPGGYHELVSFFQTTTLGDHLSFSFETEQDELALEHPVEGFPLDRSNLILKAVELFKRESGLAFHVNITINKRIPMEAGLGGGSSNAATTLFALNQLLGSPFKELELAKMGAELGSDLPFFFGKGSALCLGRGEIIEEKAPLLEPFYLIKPLFGMSTKEVFRAFSLEHDRSTYPVSELRNNTLFFNNLEHAAFRLSPILGVFKETLLEAGFSPVVMSGSGSSFICFGKAQKPFLLPSFSFYVQFLGRKEGAWYDGCL